MRPLFVLLIGFPAINAWAGEGRYVKKTYPASENPGELKIGVTFTLWIPANVKTIRGIIVHQHGCGVGACKGGATAAYDLHWQALARKWDCALLGPSYDQKEKQNCRLWCDPRNGSAKVFLRGLQDLAKQSKHPEIANVPWCLWGHSGGGFWSSLMQTMYPERIVAIWLRSGTAYGYWTKGDVEAPKIPAAAYAIPMMCNPGIKERDHQRFKRAWNGTFEMFKEYRKKGAPAGFAPDPKTGHECGDSRYLAIPFFDACLEMRLPKNSGANQKLRAVSTSGIWLARPLSSKAVPAREFTGKDNEPSVWLPNAKVAKAWSEYVKTGVTADTTPPPAPHSVRVARNKLGNVITWRATADFESGVAAFLILRDGAQVARVPQKPNGRFGRPLFQVMSYHDTPQKPLPDMRFVDTSAKTGQRPTYRVMAINSAGLKSAPSCDAD